MMTIKTIFTFVPFAVFALTAWTYVWSCGWGKKARWLWLCWLLFCCSKFFCFRNIGGDSFYPEFPEFVIWFWNWAYSGAMMLAVLSLVWWHRSRRWLLPLVAWSLSAFGLWEGVRVPDVVEREIVFPDLPAELDGYRIVQLSDIHASSASRRWRTEKLVAKANALDADLVCLTGDYVDGRVKLREEDVAPLGNLKARDGVYAVTGNHEYYFNWAEWRKAYENFGVRFLSNACVFPRRSLALGGMNDERVCNRKTGELFGDVPDVRRTFAAATNGEFRVLLQHRPGKAAENIREVGVRLQLSGHTHGGIMPGFSYLVLVHNQGFVRGLYRIADGILYVHPGSGQWAGFPMRFLDPAEITVLTLRRRTR